MPCRAVLLNRILTQAGSQLRVKRRRAAAQRRLNDFAMTSEAVCAAAAVEASNTKVYSLFVHARPHRSKNGCSFWSRLVDGVRHIQVETLLACGPFVAPAPFDLVDLFYPFRLFSMCFLSLLP